MHTENKYYILFKRWLTNKYVLLLIGIASTCTVKALMLDNNKPTSAWDDKQTSELTAKLRGAADSLFTMPEIKRQFVNCGVEKFKLRFPHGFHGIGSGEIYSASKEIGRSCTMEVLGKKTDQ